MKQGKNWRIFVADRAKKNLRRLPKKDAARIDDAILSMETDPFYGDITKLEGEENLWRRRVGNYRITYEVFGEDNVIQIYEIKRRTSKTY